MGQFIQAANAAAAGPPADSSLAQMAEDAPTSSELPPMWRRATSEDEDQIWGFILSSPLGVAALNQLAVEGFISPVCEKTFYVHQEYGSFQSLLQVACPTQRGVNTARAYDEMWVTFNRFEDTIIDFSVERIFEDEGASLPSPVVEAVLAAAAEQSGLDVADLMVAEAEQRTWSDGCLGLGGPAESCLAALVEGWRVVVSDGDRQWVFRTNTEGTQVRFDEAASSR
ncbi:MAG TPA: hypothetical protein V6D06_08235 [Trichocoleus sp.]